MKVLALARKILFEYWREPMLLGLLFAFPVILLGFYAIAFGETEEGMAKHLKVLVLNQDQGTILPDGTAVNLGTVLVDQIAAAQYQDSPMFDLQQVENRSTAEIALREGKAALLMVLPNDFSRLITARAAEESKDNRTVISLVGYPTSDLYVFTRSILEGMLFAFSEQFVEPDQDILTIDYTFVPGTGTISDFQFGVPGLIIFGIMFIAITTAMTMVREEVRGSLKRIRLSGLNARQLFMGVTGAQLVLGVALVPFIFLCALLLGFRSQGSLLLAILVGILLTFSAVGIGLLTACFARNDGESANLSAIIGVMSVILSGAMYPMPAAPIATIAGRTIQIYDLLPTAHAGRALQRILIYGDGLAELVFELLGLSILSLFIFALGTLLYQGIKLSR